MIWSYHLYNNTLREMLYEESLIFKNKSAWKWIRFDKNFSRRKISRLVDHWFHFSQTFSFPGRWNFFLEIVAVKKHVLEKICGVVYAMYEWMRVYLVCLTIPTLSSFIQFYPECNTEYPRIIGGLGGPPTTYLSIGVQYDEKDHC